MSGVIARELERRGISCITVAGAGRRGLPDLDQLNWAGDNGRIIVSFDSDFANLARSITDHAGIIVCKPHTRDIGPVVRALAVFAASHSAEEAAGQLWYI
jgi:predicted nuclease of predicted toxin-antitoxin system